MNHHISNDNLRVVVSEYGSELQSILSKDQVEYLWQGDPAYWSGRAPTIFPYVGRLTEGSYYFQNKRYELPIHGFAPTQQFSLSEKTSNSMTLSIEDSEQIRQKYPFRFCFKTRYELHDDTLIVTYIVENRDDKTMYFGLGGHPGFNIPLEPELTFEDYSLTFSEPCNPLRVSLSDDAYVLEDDKEFPLVNDRELPLQHNLFDRDAIILKQIAPGATLASKKGKHGVTMLFPDYPMLGIWHTTKSDAPFVCLEPWSSLPSRSGVIEHLETQPGLIQLEPSSTYTVSYQLRFF